MPATGASVRSSISRVVTGRAWGGDALLLSVVAITAPCSISTTARFFNLIPVSLAVVVIVVAIARTSIAAPRMASIAVALVATAVTQSYKPPTGNMTKTWAYPWGISVGLAAVAALALAVVHCRLRAPLAGVGVGLLVASTFLTIGGGQHPQIDVWAIFQQSSAGLFHGVDPYKITHFAGVLPGQTADCFNYLPATLPGSWLGWVALGDVRYSETAVLVAGWLALAWVIARRARGAVRGDALLLLGTAMTMAGTLRVAQQAWNESLILGFLLVGAALLVSGHRMWALVPFALALATKQHIVLLVPLFGIWPMIGWRRTLYAVLGAVAVSAPWALWDFPRFKHCTVDFFIDIKPRFDSISLWQFIPGGVLQTVIVLAAVAGAYLLVVRKLPRSVGGLLIAGGVVLGSFDLFNKQTFENQWWLACELIGCGLALHLVEGQRAPAEATAAVGRSR